MISFVGCVFSIYDCCHVFNWFLINLFYFFDFCINRLIVLVFVVLLVLAFGLKREFLKLTLPFIKLVPSHLVSEVGSLHNP